MKKHSVSHLVLFSIFLFLTRNPVHPLQEQENFSPEAIVSSLREKISQLINEERNKNGLPSLNHSPDLSALAQKHCQDMAFRTDLSHVSASGETYEARLVKAGFFFIEAGENIAFSETFKAEFIHESFMNSPEHRENILNPSYNLVGIGVTPSGKRGYYITQDFLQSFEPKEREIEEIIRQKINNMRQKNSLQPLSFLEEASEYARQISVQKLQGNPLPSATSFSVENFLIYIATPLAEDAISVYREKILDKSYESAGLGISFGRTEEHPGGSYFITLILFPGNKFKSANDREIRGQILTTINILRGQEGLLPFQENSKLNEQANNVLQIVIRQKDRSSVFMPKIKGAAAYCFITPDPTQIPESIKEQIGNKLADYRKVGIAFLFAKNSKFPSGAFWISIIIGR